MKLFMSPAGSPKSFSITARVPGESGSLMTSVKLRPSGQAFCVPLHNLMRSASGTSLSLFPAAVITAVFLMAGVEGTARNNIRHAAQIARRRIGKVFRSFIPTLTFRQVNTKYLAHCGDAARGSLPGVLKGYA